MARRDFGGGGFTRSAYVDTEDADPRVGLVNLADVMLVFACGLMLALVAHWNVNLASVTEIVDNGELTEVNDITTVEEAVANGSGFNALGMVYQDPRTGKMYMIEEVGTTEGSGSNSGTGSSGSSQSN